MSEHAVAPRKRSAAPSPAVLTDDQRRQLAELVRQYQMQLYAYLRARVAQPTDADDLLQEVYLRYQAAIERFDPSRDPLPYLMGIARNLLRERARRLRRRHELTWTEVCLELEEPAEEEETPPPHQHLVPHLAGCLQTLAQHARTALQLHYERKLKLKEIGQQLGRTAGAIKLLLFRARQALKRCLDQKLEEAATEGEPAEHPPKEPPQAGHPPSPPRRNGKTAENREVQP